MDPQFPAYKASSSPDADDLLAALLPGVVVGIIVDFWGLQKSTYLVANRMPSDSHGFPGVIEFERITIN
jgi:hypothetical protein